MQSEFDALIRNKTWDLVPSPYDANLIRCMWIFRYKKHYDGPFKCYKARLIGDGRSQVASVNCDETFNSEVKPAIIRIMLTIALSKPLGPFINWMYIMPFYMVIFMILFTCINHWVSANLIIQIMYIVWISHFMASSKCPEHGTNALLTM